MNNPKVFITGWTGFVGQNLTSYLKKDFNIQGISRKAKLGELNYSMFLEQNRSYDAIVHLAGKAHDLKKTSNNLEYYEANFELTKKLYNQFLASDAQIFIYVSSVKAVADTVTAVLTEDVIANPITVYGKSKKMAEDYILAHLPLDKKVYILRPCMIHGPGNKGNLNLLYSLVSRGIPYPLGAYDNSRSFLSIENLCFVINHLLKSDIPSAVFNVADDVPLSTNEVIALVSESLGKKSNIIAIPKIFIHILASIGDVLPLPINSEKLQKLTENFVVSNHKLIEAMGTVLPIDSKKGLLTTFNSFKFKK
jgi:nucleoside-diphosphate-sugar epimerase